MKQAEYGLELVENIKKQFRDYLEKGQTGNLYNGDKELPKHLITLYYRLGEKYRDLNDLKEQFVNHYIECECILEGSHSTFEYEGLREMYDYIHSNEINRNFDVFTLLELHRKLYSKAPYPDAGGVIRNAPAHLNNVAIDLSPSYTIREELRELDSEVKDLFNLGQTVSKNPDMIFGYINRCVILKCKLIKIHPFFDGNGRSIRGFINKLFLNAGLPSVYILEDENEKYRAAMQEAIGEEENYESIIQFYYYKICDSICELDIQSKIDGVIPIGRHILDVATMINFDIEDYNVSHQEWNNELVYRVERALNEEGIKCHVYSTTQFDETLIAHNFIVIFYKKKVQYKRLILDPMFKKLYEEDLLDLTKADKTLFDNLVSNGVTSFTNMDLTEYIKFFKERENSLSSDTQIEKVKTHKIRKSN